MRLYLHKANGDLIYLMDGEDSELKALDRLENLSKEDLADAFFRADAGENRYDLAFRFNPEYLKSVEAQKLTKEFKQVIGAFKKLVQKIGEETT